jgi:hypothetical protein
MQYIDSSPCMASHLGTTLWDNGFVLSISSTSMFLLHLPEVDEIVVFSSAATSRLVHRLCFRFVVNNLGPLDYFFRIKASYSQRIASYSTQVCTGFTVTCCHVQVQVCIYPRVYNLRSYRL